MKLLHIHGTIKWKAICNSKIIVFIAVYDRKQQHKRQSANDQGWSSLSPQSNFAQGYIWANQTEPHCSAAGRWAPPTEMLLTEVGDLWLLLGCKYRPLLQSQLNLKVWHWLWAPADPDHHKSYCKVLIQGKELGGIWLVPLALNKSTGVQSWRNRYVHVGASFKTRVGKRQKGEQWHQTDEPDSTFIIAYHSRSAMCAQQLQEWSLVCGAFYFIPLTESQQTWGLPGSTFLLLNNERQQQQQHGRRLKECHSLVDGPVRVVAAWSLIGQSEFSHWV